MASKEPSKELCAWMRKYCRRRDRCFGETRCMDLLSLPECPPEGRPDCPAIRELLAVLEKEPPR
jgi:hypothetical protein